MLYMVHLHWDSSLATATACSWRCYEAALHTTMIASMTFASVHAHLLATTSSLQV
jgi:hypothetical protein